MYSLYFIEIMFNSAGVLRYKSFHRNRMLRTLLSLESQSHVALNGSNLSTSSKLNERLFVVVVCGGIFQLLHRIGWNPLSNTDDLRADNLPLLLFFNWFFSLCRLLLGRGRPIVETGPHPSVDVRLSNSKPKLTFITRLSTL